MTPTRISKIARLPHTLREQLNHRLQNGELSRTILPWMNSLPETKTVMADLFGGNAITHQNISDWRRTGYQDWLLQQQRLQWFATLTEHETEIDKHDQCNDTFEAMSNYFIFELGQAITSLRDIKNTHDRLNRLETLTREFSRLQNAFNWSRRVQLEFAKYNDSGTGVPPVSSAGGASVPASRVRPETTEENEIEISVEPPTPPDLEIVDENGERARPGRGETRPRVSPLGSATSQDSNLIEPPEQEKAETQNPELETNPPEPKRQRTGALQDAPRTSEAQEQRASVLDCGSPLPLSDVNSSTPKLVNSETPRESQPNPAPAPTTPPPYPINPRVIEETNHIRKNRKHYWPTRGHRFVCVEG